MKKRNARTVFFSNKRARPEKLIPASINSLANSSHPSQSSSRCQHAAKPASQPAGARQYLAKRAVLGCLACITADSPSRVHPSIHPFVLSFVRLSHKRGLKSTLHTYIHTQSNSVLFCSCSPLVTFLSLRFPLLAIRVLSPPVEEAQVRAKSANDECAKSMFVTYSLATESSLNGLKVIVFRPPLLAKTGPQLAASAGRYVHLTRYRLRMDLSHPSTLFRSIQVLRYLCFYLFVSAIVIIYFILSRKIKKNK